MKVSKESFKFYICSCTADVNISITSEVLICGQNILNQNIQLQSIFIPVCSPTWQKTSINGHMHRLNSLDMIIIHRVQITRRWTIKLQKWNVRTHKNISENCHRNHANLLKNSFSPPSWNEDMSAILEWTRFAIPLFKWQIVIFIIYYIYYSSSDLIQDVFLSSCGVVRVALLL